MKRCSLLCLAIGSVLALQGCAYAIMADHRNIPTHVLHVPKVRISATGAPQATSANLIVPAQFIGEGGFAIDGRFVRVEGTLQVVNCLEAFALITNGIDGNGEEVDLLKAYGVDQVELIFSEEQSQGLAKEYCATFRSMHEKKSGSWN